MFSDDKYSLEWLDDWVVIKNQYFYNGYPLWWIAGYCFSTPTNENITRLCDILGMGDGWARITALKLLTLLDIDKKIDNNDSLQTFYEILHEWCNSKAINDLTAGSDLVWDPDTIITFKAIIRQCILDMHHSRSQEKHMKNLKHRLTGK